MEINDVLKKDFVKALVGQVCDDDTTLIERGTSFAVRAAEEGDRDIHRVILLPPRGFTANAPNQMNSHDEAEFATIEVKGVIREGKHGFSKIKDCLLVASHSENGDVSGLNQPYLTFQADAPQYGQTTLKKHSAGGSPFAVVKSDGFGFYHNLINLTDEWLALKLHKRLRPQKAVELEPLLEELPKEEASHLGRLYSAVVQHGDAVFAKEPKLIDGLKKFPVQRILPALGEMLFIHDSGMHEACTVFAVILKLSKDHPQEVSAYLEEARSRKSVPGYYATQLLGKIAKAQSAPAPNLSKVA